MPTCDIIHLLLCHSEQYIFRSIGCSVCLFIAIESSSPALLKSLLRRSDVFYRDIFWMPTPREWDNYSKEEFPNCIHSGSDLSLVGRDDCGHLQVDVDLLSPLDVLWEPNASFWCRYRWWRVGTPPNGSTPSEFCAIWESSTTRSLSSSVISIPCSSFIKGPLQLFYSVACNASLRVHPKHSAFPLPVPATLLSHMERWLCSASSTCRSSNSPNSMESFRDWCPNHIHSISMYSMTWSF